MKTAEQKSLGNGSSYTILSTDPVEAPMTSVTAPPTAALATQPPTAMDLLQIALSREGAIEVIKELAALRDRERDHDAEIQFNEAMNKAQSELGRIAPDLENPQTHSKYASYAALDKKLRPIYTRHGFSLSFDSAESKVPEMVQVVCYVSHKGGHTRTYHSPLMPADGKGAKGGDVMTKTHATGSAMSYGMRYLLKYIFNVAIGQEDDDGNLGTNGELVEQLEWIASARNTDELKSLYKAAYKQFEANPAALKAVIAAKDKRLGEIQ